MKNPFLAFLLIFFCANSLKAQLKEFEISPLSKPEISLVQANTEFGEDALIIIYSSLTNLNFRSSMGMIDKQSYNPQSNRYEILVKPKKQMLFVFANEFMEGNIATINPKPKQVYYYKVEEKINSIKKGKGFIDIETLPSECEIFLNGLQLLPKSPCLIEVVEGSVQLSLKKSKYLTIDTIIQIQDLDKIKIKHKFIKDPNFLDEISIGVQTWMSENLNIGSFRNGDTLIQARTEMEWRDACKQKKAAWCYYDFNKNNGDVYGRLYNIFAVLDSRKIAPYGWHVPTDSDWLTLEFELGGEKKAANELRSSKGWVQNGNGNNKSNFTGLPGGYHSIQSGFFDIGLSANWWTSTYDYDSKEIWTRNLQYNENTVGRGLGNFVYAGFSIRCIKDY